MPFNCEKCGEVFPQGGSLRSHVEFAHPIEMARDLESDQAPLPALEDVCKDTKVDPVEEASEDCEDIPALADMEIHSSRTDITTLSIFDYLCCEKCGKSFRVKRQLDSHICLDEVMSNLRTETLNKKHMKTSKRKNQHNADDSKKCKLAKMALDESGQSFSKALRCQECLEECFTQSDFEKHMIMHDKETELSGEDEEGSAQALELTLTDVKGSVQLEDYSKTEEKNESKSFADVINECIADANDMTSTSQTEDREHLSPASLLVQCPNQTNSSSNIDEVQNQRNSPKGKNLSDVLPKLFECELCGEGFGRKTMLEAHSEAIHYGKKYRCNSCQVDFKRKSNFIRHNIRSHSDLAYKCDKCPKAFIAKEDLEHHVNAHSSKDNMKGIIQCTDCKMFFVYKKDLKAHRREYHKVAPQITDKQPVIIPDFVMKEHGAVSVFRCSLCPRAFSLKTDLQRHFLIHSGEKPFACDICDSRFNRKSNLVRHRRLMHRIQEDRPSRVKTGTGRRKKDHHAIEPWEEEIKRQDEELIKWKSERRLALFEAEIEDEVEEQDYYWKEDVESDKEGDSLEVAYFKPDDKVTVRILTFE